MVVVVRQIRPDAGEDADVSLEFLDEIVKLATSLVGNAESALEIDDLVAAGGFREAALTFGVRELSAQSLEIALGLGELESGLFGLGRARELRSELCELGVASRDGGVAVGRLRRVQRGGSGSRGLGGLGGIGAQREPGLEGSGVGRALGAQSEQLRERGRSLSALGLFLGLGVVSQDRGDRQLARGSVGLGTRGPRFLDSGGLVVRSGRRLARGVVDAALGVLELASQSLSLRGRRRRLAHRAVARFFGSGRALAQLVGARDRLGLGDARLVALAASAIVPLPFGVAPQSVRRLARSVGRSRAQPRCLEGLGAPAALGEVALVHDGQASAVALARDQLGFDLFVALGRLGRGALGAVRARSVLALACLGRLEREPRRVAFLSRGGRLALGGSRPALEPLSFRGQFAPRVVQSAPRLVAVRHRRLAPAHETPNVAGLALSEKTSLGDCRISLSPRVGRVGRDALRRRRRLRLLTLEPRRQRLALGPPRDCLVALRLEPFEPIAQPRPVDQRSLRPLGLVALSFDFAQQ